MPSLHRRLGNKEKGYNYVSSCSPCCIKRIYTLLITTAEETKQIEEEVDEVQIEVKCTND